MFVRICCLLFVLVLFLPTIQDSFNFLPSTYLVGVEGDPPRAKWSTESWLDGSFQKQYTKRRDSRLGLRSYFVKTYNQIHYSLFSRVVSRSGTNVVIGKEKWLYEKVYVEKLNKVAWDDGSLIKERAQKLRILQDQLEALGIAFVFVVAPSKAEVYPEYIPNKLKKEALAPGTATDYSQAIEALQKNGVHFLDGPALFLEEKEEKGYQLFGSSGVHWNRYGAYLAWRDLAPLVNERINVPLQVPPLLRVESRPSELVEADLGGLLNIWDSAFSAPVTDYPLFVDVLEKREKPSILIVGDSFLFTLIGTVETAALSTDVDAWYYFKRHFKYPTEGDRINSKTPIETVMDRKAIDWQNQLLNKDLVVLVATEYWLPVLGFGFVEETSAAIERLSNGEKP